MEDRDWQILERGYKQLACGQTDTSRVNGRGYVDTHGTGQVTNVPLQGPLGRVCVYR